MPPVIVAAAAAGAAAGATALGASAFVAAMASWAGGAIASYVVGGTAPASVALDRPDTLLSNEPSNTAPLPVVYGSRRMGATVVFAEVNGGANQYLDVVYAICEGEIDSIGTVYLDNEAVAETVAEELEPLQFTASTNRWVRIRMKLAEAGSVSGTFTGTWDDLLDWADATYGGTLVLTREAGDFGGDDDFTITCAPFNLSSWTDSRPLMLGIDLDSEGSDWRTVVDVEQEPTADNGWELIVKVHAMLTGEGTNPYVVTATMETMTEGARQYAGRVQISRHTGADDQLADADLVARSDSWTADHRLAGVAYCYLRFHFNEGVFPRGVPVATFDVRGRLLLDVRDDTTGYSDNPALANFDYLTNARYGRGVPVDEIDVDSFVAVANYCDQVVDVESGEKRWTCNGAVATDRTALDNMRLLLTSCRSWLTFASGRYRLVADGPATAVMDFNEGNITGAWQINLGDKNTYANRVLGQFFDPEQDYRSDFAPADSPELRALDRGLLLERTIPLEFTRTKREAYRHAAIELNQSRQAISVQFAAMPEGFRVMPGDVVTITHGRPGWSAKKFRVLSMGLRSQADVGLVVREYSDAVYDWGTIPVFDTAPNTNLPSAGVALRPGEPRVIEELYSTRGGAGVKAKALVDWDAPADPYLVEYRLEAMGPAAIAWQVVARPTTPAAEVLDITPGRWMFRVQAVNSIGVKSAYSPVTVADIQGLLAPPSTPSNLALTAHSLLAMITWDPSPDLDVRTGGSFRVRFVPASNTTPTWDDGLDIGPAVPGVATHVLLPLLAGTYLMKAVDSSGVESTTAAGVETDAPGLWDLVSVGTWSGGASWTGTHTGTEVSEGVLRLEQVSGSVVELDGTWESTGGLTLASEKRVRLEAELDATAYNAQDEIDDRVGDVDTWPDWDGAVNGAATVVVWVSAYDNTGAVWRPWVRLTASDFVAQQFKFKVVLHSTGAAYNIGVTQLTVTAREVA
jgi:hypothetical protein